MHRCNRIISAVLLASIACALGACAGDDFDPQEKIADLIPDFSKKKPLPGERKQVFPEGVPGVAKGVPPDLLKGNQPADVASAPIETPQPTPEKPKPKKIAKPKAKPAAQPATQNASAPWPDQLAPAQPQQPQPQSAWPSQSSAAAPASAWPGDPAPSASSAPSR